MNGCGWLVNGCGNFVSGLEGLANGENFVGRVNCE